MTIDKSKMTPAEKAFFEDIEKRYGVKNDPGNASTAAQPTAATVSQVAPAAHENEPDALAKALQALSISTPTPATATQKTAESGEDIYKGLHPQVKAELEALRKFREEAEDRELKAVAKKYELIGKKPEELVPVLKSLKSAGGTAYADMIAMLDQTLETVEKSGVFSEIGKSGHESDNAVETKVDGIAKGYMEKDPAMNYSQAIAKAWEEHPELIAEYDEQAGF